MAASEDYGYLAKVPTVKMEKEPEGRLAVTIGNSGRSDHESIRRRDSSARP
jgi:hypothetical protein